MVTSNSNSDYSSIQDPNTRIDTVLKHCHEITKIYSDEITHGATTTISKLAREQLDQISLFTTLCKCIGQQEILFGEEYNKLIQSIEQFHKKLKNIETVNLFRMKFQNSIQFNQSSHTEEQTYVQTLETAEKIVIELQQRGNNFDNREIKNSSIQIDKHCTICKSTNNLKICSDCKCHYYCCKDHQSIHWNQGAPQKNEVPHKTICKQLKLSMTKKCLCCEKELHFLGNDMFLLTDCKTHKYTMVCKKCFLLHTEEITITQEN